MTPTPSTTRQVAVRRAAGISTLLLLAGIAVVLLLAALFIRLADEVVEPETLRFDRSLALAIHATTSPIQTSLMFVVTEFGKNIETVLAALWLLVGSLLTWQVAQRHQEIWPRVLATAAPIVALLGALLLSTVIKDLIGRQRPTLFPPLISELGFSFPSGHTLTGIAFYGCCAFVLARGTRSWLARFGWFALGAIIVSAIGYSRIYLGVHYPSDVFGSGLLGLAWLITIALTLTIVSAHYAASTPDPTPAP